MTVQIQVIPASSSLGTSGGLVAGTGCSVFISQDHFDTTLDIVAQVFQETDRGIFVGNSFYNCCDIYTEFM